VPVSGHPDTAEPIISFKGYIGNSYRGTLSRWA